MPKPKPLANTFLTHLFGQGLADERYEIKRKKSTGGKIRSLPKRRERGARANA